MIEETTERKVSAKRVAVAVLLSLAALGTRYIPRNPMLVNEPEPVRRFVADADDSAKPLTGQNSLLGDAPVDRSIDTLASSTFSSAGLSQYHLDDSRLVDQAGFASVLDRIDPASVDATPSATSGSVSVNAASAVPEPNAMGYLAMALAPMVMLRRPRHHRH